MEYGCRRSILVNVRFQHGSVRELEETRNGPQKLRRIHRDEEDPPGELLDSSRSLFSPIADGAFPCSRAIKTIVLPPADNFSTLLDCLCQVLLLFFGFGLLIESFTCHPRARLSRGLRSRTCLGPTSRYKLSLSIR